jgi:sulfate permease, SulP family
MTQLISGAPAPADKRDARQDRLETWLPKSIVCLREGYGRQFLLQDILAGVTVAIIALPLAMAFAIGSGPGIRPEQGLYTAIIGGFIIALLGGSRVSVAGPTGAFMPILYAVVATHGYNGLVIASMMAGVILILMGLFKLGSLIKYIPYPVTTGFTSGIAVIIFSGEIKDLFGLKIQKVPPAFLAKWSTYFAHFHTLNSPTAIVAIGSILLILILRKLNPRIPGAIIAVIITAALVGIFHLDTRFGVETLETRFGQFPRALPHLIHIDFSAAAVKTFFTQAQSLIPEATTIALLASIESLLCCVVSDGMIGGRHKSNVELVGQGIGNIASVLFGGIPATGAIARTAANVKAGGRTPLASMVHAVVVLVVMLALAPYAGKIPLAVLAAILVVVAYNMAEIDHFRTLLKSPRSDILVLLTTFGLTVLADLSVAVGVGMILASILFMKRMTEVTNVAMITDDLEGKGLGDEKEPNSMARRMVPDGVEIFEIAGPFFFGVVDRLKDTLRGLEKPPLVFILRMQHVTAIDATGMHAVEELYLKCHRQGTRLLLAGVHAQPLFAFAKYGLNDRIGEHNLFESIDDALNAARQILGTTPLPAPAGAQPEVARQRPPS